MAEFKGKQGHWVTTESGSHLFIESGGSFEEAVESAFGKENAKKYKKYEEKTSNESQESYDANFESESKEKKLADRNNDLEDEDIMQEIADGDYYYGGLEEQEIYNLAAERLNTTPEHVEEALKNQGFDYQQYQKYINGEEFDSDYSDVFDENKFDIQGYEKELLPDEKQRNALKEKWGRLNKRDPNASSWLEILEQVDHYGYEDVNESLNEALSDIDSNEFDSNNDFETWEDGSDDFDKDLEVAFKKHGPNDDAILDELRASGKDYGMSNSDLQGVVEAYTLRHSKAPTKESREQTRNKAVDIVNQEEWYDQKSKESVIQAFTDKNTQKEILKNIKNNDYFASYYYDIERVLNNGGEGFSDLNNYAKSALAFVAKQTLKK